MRIRGKRIILRDEWRKGDDEDLFRWLSLEEWNYYDEPDRSFEGISREAFERQLEERRHGSAEPSSHSHTWQVDTVEGRHIGWVNYHQLDEQAKRAYVGICLPEEETWGKGYGTQAVRLLVHHLFHEMELQEIRTATWTGNRRMVRCAEKSSFKEIGRMPHRAEYSVRGEPLERVEFSIGCGEWLAARGGA